MLFKMSPILKTNFNLDFEKNTDVFYRLLKEEDFSFSNRSINIEVKKVGKNVDLNLEADSILNLKIGLNSIMNSLEIIDKTIKI